MPFSTFTQLSLNVIFAEADFVIPSGYAELPWKTMNIKYKINEPITTDQFISLLESSTLGQRRPIDDKACMQGMISNSNLIVSAWDNGILIGIARSLTDFHYACYLSDLAVSKKYQKAGIGKQLQILTQRQLGPRCNLILVAAPAANSYYDHLGYKNNKRCWILERDSSIRS
jgi:ribosomal protein S18 acetylase RimI-like enzyme